MSQKNILKKLNNKYDILLIDNSIFYKRGVVM